MVSCWVDWNNDGVFDTGTDEEFQLENIGGSGQTFEGTIIVPIGSSDDYRMRVRMTYNETPQPCGSSSYGEVEDYTILVIGTYENDIALLSVVSPDGSGTFTNDESIIISIFNGGLTPQSNIPWQVKINGPLGEETLNGIFSERINS